MSKRTIILMVTLISYLMYHMLFSVVTYAFCENETRQIKELEKQLLIEKAVTAKVTQQLNASRNEVSDLKERLKNSGSTEKRFNIAVIAGIVGIVGMFLFGIILGSKARKDSQLVKEG